MTETPDEDRARSFSRRRRQLVLLLCLIAAIRVFLFSAGFTLFNNVDEHCHFDLVWRYSRGRVPHGLEKISPESSRLLVLYGSWEFLTKPRDVAESWISHPLWAYQSYQIQQIYDRLMAFWTGLRNHEGVQPPLYYVLAGAWYRLGELLGLSEGQAVYWVRFLDVLILPCLVWFSYVFAGRLYPQKDFLRLSLPLVLAFLPQDLFYSINNGVLSPLLCGLAFYFALEIASGNRAGYLVYSLCGLCMGAAMLTAYTNAPILVVLAWSMMVRLRAAARIPSQHLSAGRLELRRQGLMLLVMLLPVGGWLAVNFRLTGHLTNAAEYMSAAGWRPKALGEMFQHPIFTPAGALLFWRELMSTYFRGEFSWGAVWLADKRADGFYWASSLVFLAAAANVIWRDRRMKLEGKEGSVGSVSMAYFAVSLLMLVSMSIRYDFGHWYYPSRHHPYFVSGRLIGGTMVPFFALYLIGLERILSIMRLRRAVMAFVLAIAALAFISEMAISIPVFRSMYNWFHLA